MSWPGPSGVVWALELIVWAGGAVVLGELVRFVMARLVRSWAGLEAIERLLLDFYLGGAAMFLAAALPIGGFVAPVIVGLPILGAAGLVLLGIRLGPRGRTAVRAFLASVVRPVALLALATALLLFVFELAVALPVATGNTYDASLLTTYVALLLQHHTIPLSFQPYATVGLLYPQGTTVWLGWAQSIFGLPPARTSLLVTPLFFGLAPLGAFVFGRRAFGTDRAALACAVFLAAVGSWTRVLVAGSTDFVFAFPLVLLLGGQAIGWLRSGVPRWPDALAFGLLAGYSAAMNPVGAEWLFPTMVLAALFATPRFGGAPWRWLARWAGALAAAFVALIPTVFVLVAGRNSPGFTPGAGAAPPGATIGITTPQFLGSIDPYLFGPRDVWLSPVAALRLELAVLLTVGLGLLMLVSSSSALGRFLGPFRRFLLAAGIVQLGLLGLLWSASFGFAVGVRWAAVSSAAELSIWLFTLYTLVGASVLVVLIEWATARVRPGTAPAAPPPAPPRPRRAALPAGTVTILLVLVIIVPGVALTPAELPPVLSDLYSDFGNVSASDFALLAYAGAHLPAGARVLIAPGSAAGFLPGYAPDLVLVYPLVPGYEWLNASYRTVVTQLTNATLNATGLAALTSLDVQYLIVTGNNTVLWRPFSPAPLLADPSRFDLVWNEGDAYLFEQLGG